MEMQQKVEKLTKKYSKMCGTIQINRGKQTEEVKWLLEHHGYFIKDVSYKKSRTTLIFSKEMIK